MWLASKATQYTEPMSWLIPRSMGGLVATGYLLAAAPLVLAIGLAGVSLERLAAQSEILVNQSVVVARLGAALREDLVNQERSARQYIALDNPELLEVYAQRRTRAEQSLRRFASRGAQGSMSQDVRQVTAALSAANAAWDDARGGTGDARVVADQIHRAVEAAEALIAAGSARVDAEVTALRETTRQARNIVVLSVGALIPLALLLAFALTKLVVRPLHRAGRGIAELGHSRYAQAIEISYPSEMQQLGVQLDWLRQRLAALEADKDRFLAHVTHELKTPLASLREGVSLLGDGTLGEVNAAQAEVCGILDESARELESMIINLLAYAQWRTERDDSPAESFDVTELFEEVAAGRKLLLATRQLSLQLRSDGRPLSGQRTRIREVLDNLIGNAIKHAPAGSQIEVDAGVAQGLCQISVRDYGRGVPEEARQRIFEAFVRGEEPEESSTRGTGVGLSIVRETVSDHRGSVEVEDAAPGARFKLSWPSQSVPAVSANDKPGT